MKITDYKTYVVGNPPPRKGGRYFIFVKLIADNGIEGIGECYVATFGPHTVAQMIGDVIERHVIGIDPFHIEKMWRNVYGSGFSLRPDVTLVGVLSGIEMACWDIAGKSVEKPVYELLGGKVNERLRSYTYLYPDDGDVYPDPNAPNVYNDPDIAAEVAVKRVEEGFTAVKFDPAGPYTVYDGHQPTMDDLDLSERFCRRIREAVGTRADLLFGTHGQFTVSGAKRMARRLEPYEPLWFEEPTTPENPADMAEIARYTCIPVATGERLCTKHEFARVIETGAASILQMNLGRVGGILEAKKIASMAETRQVQIAPHLYCGPIVAAANIQLATCSPNFLILESIEQWGGFYSDVLKSPIQWEDGDVIPPSAPGLGVELNEDVALAHPYEGDTLHLTMDEAPHRP